MDTRYLLRNTTKTVVLLGAIGGLLVAVGSLLGGTTGAVLGLGLGLLICGGSYWFSDRLALRAAGAVPVTAAEAPALHAMVEDLATRAGVPTPSVHLIDEDQPNAFATGRSPRHAAVAVTRGLLEVCPPDEVRGVLAHEIGHIRHRDILIGSIAAAVATGISFLANIAMFAGMFSTSDDDDGPGPFAALLIAVLAPVAATLLQLALSRSREFEADRAGAAILGDPEPLARALARIDAIAARTPVPVAPTQAGAYIVNPLTGNRLGVAKLFLSHPPVEERIARLRTLQPAS